MKNELRISVLFIQEKDGRWSAQCLEYDITAQANTPTNLHYEFERVLMSHLVVSQELNIEPFEGIGPAPQKFWDMYRQAKLSVQAEDVPFRLPHPAVISSVIPTMKIAGNHV